MLPPKECSTARTSPPLLNHASLKGKRCHSSNLLFSSFFYVLCQRTATSLSDDHHHRNVPKTNKGCRPAWNNPTAHRCDHRCNGSRGSNAPAHRASSLFAIYPDTTSHHRNFRFYLQKRITFNQTGGQRVGQKPGLLTRRWHFS